MYAVGRLNRQKTDEQQKKEWEEAAQVYNEFIKDFQDDTTNLRNHSKAPKFVRAGAGGDESEQNVIGGITVLNTPPNGSGHSTSIYHRRGGSAGEYRGDRDRERDRDDNHHHRGDRRRISRFDPRDNSPERARHHVMNAFKASSESDVDDDHFVKRNKKISPKPEISTASTQKSGFFGAVARNQEERLGLGTHSKKTRLREIDKLMSELKAKHGDTDNLKPLKDMQLYMNERTAGSHPTTNDLENSTNLFIQAIAAEITEEALVEKFSEFGRVKSCKIMYPRTEEQYRWRNNCGFISFERREEAEDAKEAMDNFVWGNQALRIGWGKALCTGSSNDDDRNFDDRLPGFNTGSSKISTTSPTFNIATEGGQPSSPVAVDELPILQIRIPESDVVRNCIDVFARYVAEHGFPLEQLVMESLIERDKVDEYSWLFDPQCSDHYYYRWRVYAFFQGDTKSSWYELPFQISTDSFIRYQAPLCVGDLSKYPNKRRKIDTGLDTDIIYTPRENFGSWGREADSLLECVKILSMNIEMSDEEEDENYYQSTYGWSLGPKQLDDDVLTWINRFKSVHELTTKSRTNRNQNLDSREEKEVRALLRNATCKRISVSSAMTWSLDRPKQAECIAKIIIESLLLMETPWQTKLARLYIVNDILANTASALIGGSQHYRTIFESSLPRVFHHLNVYCKQKEAKEFYHKIVKMVLALDQRAIFPSVYLQGLLICLDYGQGASIVDLFLHKSLTTIPKDPVSESVAIIEGGTLLSEELRSYLGTLPVWIRRNMIEHLAQDILSLCRLVQQRGMTLGMKSRIRDKRKMIVVPPKLITEIDSKTQQESIIGVEMPPVFEEARKAPPTVRLEMILRTLAIECLVLWESYWYAELCRQKNVMELAIKRHPMVSTGAMLSQPLLHSTTMLLSSGDSNNDSSTMFVVSPSNWNGKIELGLWVPPAMYDLDEVHTPKEDAYNNKSSIETIVGSSSMNQEITDAKSNNNSRFITRETDDKRLRYNPNNYQNNSLERDRRRNRGGRNQNEEDRADGSSKDRKNDLNGVMKGGNRWQELHQSKDKDNSDDSLGHLEHMV